MCSSFLFYIIFKTLMFIRFRDLLLHLIDLTGCCILEEKIIWFETHIMMYLFSHVHIFFIRVSLTVGNLVSNKFTFLQYTLPVVQVTFSSSLASSPFFFLFHHALFLLHTQKIQKIYLLKKKCINSWLQ